MHRQVLALLTRPATPVQRAAAWLAGLAAIAALGTLRAATDAEFAFASAVIIPLVAVAWTGGRRDAFLFALLAAAMWAGADALAERGFSAEWVPLVNGATRLATYAFVAYLVAEVRLLMTRERELANHDPLTGLLNRRAFLAEGEEEARRSRRYGHPLTVAFLDLDNFKNLNDSQGHEAGDRALQAAAAALRGSLRATDRVARLGGDEFAVMLPESGYDAAADTGHKVALAVEAAMKDFAPVSASIGVAWFGTAEGSFAAMIEAADALMYEIKQNGKQGVRIRRIDPAPARSAPPTS